MPAIDNWQDLLEEMTRLYELKQYDEAGALLVSQAPRFPDRAANIAYNRLCLMALAGHADQALALLGEVVREGGWYPDSMLRSDPDLTSLQGLSEFERLAAICHERQQAARAAATPHMEVAIPDSGSPPYPALIALHGNNHNAADSMPYWKSASQQGFLVAMLQSTQVSGQDSFVWNDADRVEQDVIGHNRALIEEHPVDASRTVIGGFSMGGRIACWMAIRQALPVRGFISAAAWLKDIGDWEPHFERAAASGVRGCLLVGERDRLSYEDTLALGRMLESHHLPCQVKVFPGLRHEYPADFDAALSGALDFILNT